jgi:hypothetical protein
VNSKAYTAYTSGGTAQLVENEFTDLGHLIGETVTILGTDVDDSTTVYDDEVVDASGDITLMELSPHAHNFVRKAQIGLKYRYTLKPMRLDLVTPAGTTKGRIAGFAEVVISFFKTLGAKYGRDTDNLQPISDFSSTRYTGDVLVTTDGGFGVEDDFVISGDDPLPCNVRAIIPRKEITEE